MNQASHPKLVGLFVMGALALLVTLTLMFGGTDVLGHNKRFVAYFDGSVNGLNVGAAVKLKGVPIGRVIDVKVQYDLDKNRILTPVITEIDLNKVTETDARHLGKVVHPSLHELIDQGLRARLSVLSLVTGQLYVDINFLPDSKKNLIGDNSIGLPEIPTVASGKDELEKTVQHLATEVREIPLKEMADGALFAIQRMDQLLAKPETEASIENLNQTLANLHHLLKHLDQKLDGVTNDLSATAKQTQSLMKHLDEKLPALMATSEKTMASFDGVASPGSQLNETLRDLSEAARAVRGLAETLERQPDALLYGKSRKDH